MIPIKKLLQNLTWQTSLRAHSSHPSEWQFLRPLREAVGDGGLSPGSGWDGEERSQGRSSMGNEDPQRGPNLKVKAAGAGKGSLSACGKAEQKQGQFPNKSSVQEMHLLGSSSVSPACFRWDVRLWTDLEKALGEGTQGTRASSPLSIGPNHTLNTSVLLDLTGQFTASRPSANKHPVP